jgi:thiamine biosynthesis lipoprotein
MTLPVADPQFWIVTGAAGIALGLVLRRLFRRPKATALPCAHCPKAGQPGHPQGPGGFVAKVLALALASAASASGAMSAAPGGPRAHSELAAGTGRVERDVAAMGTRLAMTIAGPDRPTGLAVSETIVAAIEDAERRLSTWRATSELQDFNAAPPGSRVALSPLAWNAVATALACWKETDGAFDPTVAPLVEAWGLRTGGRLPDAKEIEIARLAVDAGRLVLEPERRELLQPGGLRLEEGGFGKGAALDAALAAAQALVPGTEIELDFGGQLAWSGRSQPFTFRLADPRDRSRTVLELTLDRSSGSIATSANSERGGAAGGAPIGHLLDPRSGRPAPDFGSATVFAAQAAAADCRSTGLFVLGPERGAALAARWSRESLGESVLLLVEPHGLRALVTPGLAARARALSPDLRIETIVGFS